MKVNIFTLMFFLFSFTLVLSQEEELITEAATLKEIFTMLDEAPDNEAWQSRYLQQFPKTSSAFAKLFDREDFSQLYDGYAYITYLEDLIEPFTMQVGCILTSIAVESEWKEDAFNHLQDVLMTYTITRTLEFMKLFETYTEEEQERMVLFLAGGFHGPGKKYFGLVEKLKKLEKDELALRFEEIGNKLTSSAHKN